LKELINSPGDYWAAPYLNYSAISIKCAYPTMPPSLNTSWNQ
jgi:hypothetical protein